MAKKQQTEGARLLRDKIERLIKASRGTLERQQIAAKLGVGLNTLGHWTSERRKPTLEQAIAIKRLMKIKIDAWTREPR